MKNTQLKMEISSIHLEGLMNQYQEKLALSEVCLRKSESETQKYAKLYINCERDLSKSKLYAKSLEDMLLTKNESKSGTDTFSQDDLHKQIEDIQGQIKSMEKLLELRDAQLQEARNNLEKQSAENKSSRILHNDEISSLRQITTEYENKCKDLEHLYFDSSKINTEMQTHLNENEKELFKRKEKIIELEILIAQYKNKLKELDKNNSQGTNILLNKNNLSNSTNDLKQLHVMSSPLISSNESVLFESQDKLQKGIESEQELILLEKEIRDLKHSLACKNHDIFDIIKENALKKKQYEDRLTASITELFHNNSLYSEEIEKSNEYKKYLGELSTAVVTREDNICELNSSLENHTNEFNEFKKKYNILEEELKISIELIDSLHHELENNEEKDEMNIRIIGLEKELEFSKRMEIFLKNDLIALGQDNNNNKFLLEEKISLLTTQIESLKSNINDLNIQIGDSKRLHDQKMEEINILEQNILLMGNQLLNIQQKNQNLEHELHDLKHDLTNNEDEKEKEKYLDNETMK
eukprot:gene6850-13877_t